MNEKASGSIRVVAVGDVVGRPGRQFLRDAIPTLKQTWDWDALIVNVENAAGGFGMTPETYAEFRKMGIHCMTSGNHIFDKKGYETWMHKADLMIRPLNWPPGVPGEGSMIIELPGGVKLAVLNLIGRTFMKSYDCPFRAADTRLAELQAITPLILVDFHAEATSEKMAMGHFCAGRASAVWGTHTHVPTADARIFAGHTGYITDLGMTGSYDSVIGMKKEPVIEGFITLDRTRFEVAKDDPRLAGCVFDIDIATGRCLWLQGIFISQADLVEPAQA